MQKKMTDKELGDAVMARVYAWENGAQVSLGFAKWVIDALQDSFTGDETFTADAAYMPAYVQACSFLAANKNLYQDDAMGVMSSIFHARPKGSFGNDCYEVARQYIADREMKPSREAYYSTLCLGFIRSLSL